MRQIKFRMWDADEQTMIDGDSLAFEEYAPITQLLTNEYITQFTGLTDKNGKEIYEGDIVKITDNYDLYGTFAGEIRQVRFNDGGFRLKPIYSKLAKGNWIEDGESFEVIGNIYENPELI